jgi:hypothetical protein
MSEQGTLRDSPSRTFGEVGGTALGLLLAERLTSRFPALRVAPFAISRLPGAPGSQPVTWSSGARGRDDADLARLPAYLASREIVVKPSGLAESFSGVARRGAHGAFPRFVAEPGQTWASLHRMLAPQLPDGSLAIVAQEVVAADGWPSPVMVHADGWEVRIEFDDRAARRLYQQGADGRAHLWCTADGVPGEPGWCRPVADLHHRISQDLGFPVNSEGVAGRDGSFGLVQLRPVPNDAPVDLVLACELRELERAGALFRDTPFVWGAFDMTVDARDVAAGRDCGVRRINGTRERARWSPGDRPHVQLDVAGGFCLSHSPDHLPAPGAERDAFQYIGLPGLAVEDFGDCKIRLISDGRRGGVVIQPQQAGE